MTISGPPSSLEEITSCFRSIHVKLPVYGPFHAPHLHKDYNVQQFLSSKISSNSNFWSEYKLLFALRSARDGAYFEHGLDAISLLTAIIREILNEKVNVSKIIGGCVEQLASLGEIECRVFICNATRAQDAFTKALQSQSRAKVEVEEIEKISKVPSVSKRTSRKAKLAIVGMAGRFPNASDHEKFWDLLEAGIDLHKKVGPMRLNKTLSTLTCPSH